MEATHDQEQRGRKPEVTRRLRPKGRRRIRLMRGLVALAAALLAATAPLARAPGAHAASDVLDQQQTLTYGRYEYVAADQSLAQTFMARRTGDLDRVSLDLGQDSATGNLTVGIYGTSGGLPTGSALATATVSPSSVGSSATSFSWVDVSFASPPVVIAGAQYAIVLTYGSPYSGYTWADADDDAYSGGMLFFNGGSGWVSVTAYNPATGVSVGADATFKTYVIPTVQDQTISFGPLADKTYGDAPFTVSATASSGLPVSFSAAPSSVCTASGTNGSTITITGAGTCTVTATQAGNAAYNPAPAVQQSFTVAPAPLTITANNQTMVLHGAVPAFSASYSGFVSGDGPSVVSGLTCGAADSSGNPVSSSTPVGSYPITCSGASAPNYAISYVPGTLAIQYAPAGTNCDGEAGHAILQPINADGSSVFKLGSTVTARFRVCDANGVSIGTPGVVKSFLLVKSSADSGATVDESVSSTTPDTAFRWDTTNQQWVFNMSTKGLTSGTKYYYEITLNDGTTIDFSFAVK